MEYKHMDTHKLKKAYFRAVKEVWRFGQYPNLYRSELADARARASNCKNLLAGRSVWLP